MKRSYWVSTDDGIREVPRAQFLGREHEFIRVDLGDKEHLISTVHGQGKLTYAVEEGALHIRPAEERGPVKVLRVYGQWKWAEITLHQPKEGSGVMFV